MKKIFLAIALMASFQLSAQELIGLDHWAWMVVDTPDVQVERYPSVTYVTWRYGSYRAEYCIRTNAGTTAQFYLVSPTGEVESILYAPTTPFVVDTIWGPSLRYQTNWYPSWAPTEDAIKRFIGEKLPKTAGGK